MDSLIIRSVDGTPLLAEVPGDPWPRNITVKPGDGSAQWPLRIRPARCDPRAIAEDKVGTLLPPHIVVGPLDGRPPIPCCVRNFMTLLRPPAPRGKRAVSAEVSGVWSGTIKMIALSDRRTSHVIQM